MRAFVGIDLPSAGSPASETDRPPDHLTLRFLGEIDPDRIPPIVEALERVARTVAPFSLRLDGIGAFPSSARPRVVWMGATVGKDRLVALAGQVRAALAREGSAPAEGEFVPHRTLFRVRSARSEREALDLLGGRRPPPAPIDTWVREVILKESRLAPHGAVHRALATLPLSGPVAD
jgi:RNA 2',3'-cyclic 3'-phosphodiesterase